MKITCDHVYYATGGNSTVPLHITASGPFSILCGDDPDDWSNWFTCCEVAAIKSRSASTAGPLTRRRFFLLRRLSRIPLVGRLLREGRPMSDLLQQIKDACFLALLTAVPIAGFSIGLWALAPVKGLTLILLGALYTPSFAVLAEAWGTWFKTIRHTD